MTEKLQRMSRDELEELAALQIEELSSLRSEVKELRLQLENRRIAVHEAGTLADASLRLSGIFEAADRAVTHYRINIEQLSRHQETAAREKLAEAEQQAEAALRKAQQKADTIVADALLHKQEAKREAENLLTQARLEAEEIVSQAQQLRSATKAELKAYYSDIAQSVDAFVSGRQGLQELLEEAEG